MARNDGVDRTTVRNQPRTESNIADAEAHNERQKACYRNEDIIPERSHLNIHFKMPSGSYQEMFQQMEQNGTISTRGLKQDAVHYGELVFDVNSAYFHNHGGYEYAKAFYAEAYRAAVDIVGGEQYILSAVMHADERNRAMSEALGEDVYYYHLHVVYIPVVEKQILWSKRCKDKSLVGTVKETIMQVSSSKKWQSKPALDENGNPMLTAKGKPILKKSYSVLQDDFFNAMRAAGYSDVERGERGSIEEHLTVTQFKVQAEQERLADLTQQAQQKAAEAKALDREIEKRTQKKIDIESIEKIEAKPVVLSSSRVSLAKSEYETLAAAAKKYYAQERRESKLQKALDAANKLIGELKAQITSLKQQISALTSELSEYKSVRGKIRTAGLEQENDRLRSKIRSYETAIERNNLWHIFNPHRSKIRNWDDAR